mgnify:CR=1 FL=1
MKILLFFFIFILLFQVLGYISTTQAAMEEQQGVVQFLEHVKKYALTKAEMLQILNHCPTTEVELHLVRPSACLLCFVHSVRRA